MRLKLALPPIVTLLVAAGCGPEAVPEASFSPSDIGSAAISQYDTDGDQKLSKTELKACPAILSSLEAYDQNSDDKVDASEIQARLEPFLTKGISYMAQSCIVTFRNQPLPDATVVLEPEEFMGPTVLSAEGIADRKGGVSFDAGQGYGACIGVFKVRVTHPDKQIPAKYNTETTLGLEVDPTLANTPIPVFEVGK